MKRWIVVLVAASAAFLMTYALAYWLMPALLSWAMSNLSWTPGQSLIGQLNQFGPFGVAGVAAAATFAAGRSWAADSKPRRRSAGSGLPPGYTQGAVARPEKVAEVRALLTGKRAKGTVAITTALHGEGGFGKTMLAHLVCADRKVGKHFPGGVQAIELGQELRGAALAGAISDVIARLHPEAPHAYTQPQEAGKRLCELLDLAPRTLLLLDDVWFEDQLAPFRYGTGGWHTLVTTRVPQHVRDAGRVEVDQMTTLQADALIRRGPAGTVLELPPNLVTDLFNVCGQWALLLENVNGQLRAAHEQGVPDLASFAAALCQQLRDEGPAVLDFMADDGNRRSAVKATIDAGIRMSPALDAQRVYELGIFAEDTPIPLEEIATLWAATGGLTRQQTLHLVQQAAARSLFRYRLATQTVQLHDVIRSYFRAELGKDGLQQANQALLAQASADLPNVDGQRAWWKLPVAREYLWQHLIWHLRDAGLLAEAEGLVANLHWISAKLVGGGVAGLAADLADIDIPKVQALRRSIDQTVHLLAPTVPAHSTAEILLNRLAVQPLWTEAVSDFAPHRVRPWLEPLWPLPDTPHPALKRTLLGHAESVVAATVAHDGSWLATAGDGGTLRIWDPLTGRETACLEGHTGSVFAIGAAPDGTTLVSGGYDKTIRIWNVAGQTPAQIVHFTEGRVFALEVAPNGSWIAAGEDGALLRGYSGAVALLDDQVRRVYALAVAPDSAWFATANGDGTVRIFSTATGEATLRVRAHTDIVRAVAIAPDGTWFATASYDQTIRTWDSETGRQLAQFDGHTGRVYAVAIAPDGSWLASAGEDQTVRMWDSETGRQLARLDGHTGRVYAVAIAPDGSWLASAGEDKTVRLWDTSAALQTTRHERNLHTASAVAIGPGGRWLATADKDGTVRAWDIATRRQITVQESHIAAVRAAAVAKHDRWLSTVDQDGTLRLTDTTNAAVVLESRHDARLLAAAWGPGGLLAVGSGSGVFLFRLR